jgi:YggT family protein
MFLLVAVLIRLLLQVARADFYNPISQFIVKVTNPFLLPLRKLIPGLGGLDLAAIVLALIIQLIATIVLIQLRGYDLPNVAYMIAWGGLGILNLILNIYFVAVIVAIVVSWVAPYSTHPAILLIRQFTEPAMAPFRKIMPDLGGLDLSPIFLFLTIQVLQILLGHAGASLGLPEPFVLGA